MNWSYNGKYERDREMVAKKTFAFTIYYTTDNFYKFVDNSDVVLLDLEWRK